MTKKLAEMTTQEIKEARNNSDAERHRLYQKHNKEGLTTEEEAWIEKACKTEDHYYKELRRRRAI